MQAAQAKKEKEMQKKAVRKEKKKFRDTCKVSEFAVDCEGWCSPGDQGTNRQGPWVQFSVNVRKSLFSAEIKY